MGGKKAKNRKNLKQFYHKIKNIDLHSMDKGVGGNSCQCHIWIVLIYKYFTIFVNTNMIRIIIVSKLTNLNMTQLVIE